MLLSPYIAKPCMQGISQEGKNSAFCMNWETKCSWGSGCTVNSLVVSRGPGGKALEKFTIFSLKYIVF